MSDGSKVLFLGLIGLCELLEAAVSDEGLLALWVGLAAVGWIQQAGGSAIAVLGAGILALLDCRCFE